ncbi:hypothetical protein PILCRDRAFT_824825 [Piloderma croceum F 1598]|uniref:Carbohydrate-binding module family 13 protein n=1 Tax=Piloderma croceum (strain F 1598) TaxID=765440 RepID=A0A0C3BLD1_PILCF|nr:hypothetical protein PILCRDRAFT_824825 [Piloderma croceum F 1598]
MTAANLEEPMSATGSSSTISLLPPELNGPQDNFGFPKGYFRIRSVTSQLYVSVHGWARDRDGQPLSTWHYAASQQAQVFFIDYAGALCTKAGGNAIDVVDNTLVVRHRHPVTEPWPNPWSHPLPIFTYSKSTKRITITFACDPALTHNWPRPDHEWKGREYVIAGPTHSVIRTHKHKDLSQWATTSMFAEMMSADNANWQAGQWNSLGVEDHATDALDMGRKMWELEVAQER